MKTETKRKLLSIFFPERCPYCGDVITPCEMYCEECKDKIPINTYKKKISGVYEILSVAPYEGIFKKAMLRFKFQKLEQYAYPLARLMAEKIIKEFETLCFDVITYVPLHPDDLEERGFNQCELLAKYLSEAVEIPYENLLKKTRKNKPQHMLVANKRKKNVEGVFKPLDKARIKGKRILIIDDIITTGCTLNECIKVLEKSGALEIYGMTFAITLSKTT